jgi:hypothetical protein
MKIIFFNEAHCGDGYFFKSFIKQFCELNYNIDIYLMLKYNSFVFSDIPNLYFITASNDINYTDDNFNGNNDPYNCINLNNNEYIYHYNILQQKFLNDNYLFINNIFYIKIWIGNSNCATYLECDLIKCNNYYNNIINTINNVYETNFQLIKYCSMLPTIPTTNINKFLLFKQNRKIIFYYNYICNSGLSWIYHPDYNHDNNILYLSNLFADHIICCALKPNVSNVNIISIEDFGYVKDITCENIAKAYYCALNSDIVFSFDTGACFYYLNNSFNDYFKGIWYHVSLDTFYYNRINDILKNNKVKFIDNIRILQ